MSVAPLPIPRVLLQALLVQSEYRRVLQESRLGAPQVDSQQARYLLGLCYVFTEHYADAVAVLEPLWPQMSIDFTYLYVLDIAAHNANNNDLDEKALNRLVEVGGQTPEFHLILGKAYLNREELDKAISELERVNLPRRSDCKYTKKRGVSSCGRS